MRTSHFKKLAFGIVISSALIGTSLLASSMNEVKVTLANPLSAPQSAVIAGDGIFDCSGNTCIATMERQSPMARDCRPLARQVGKVASFKVGALELDAAGLATCNKGIN